MKQILPLMLAIAVSTTASAAEWPRFHGPNIDNKSPDTGLLKTWPEGGPDRLWEVAGIGEGYSSAVIADGLIYTSGAIDDACVITALNPEGKVVWQKPNGKAWKGSYPGTRSTPTVDDGLLYHLNGNGNFICMNAATGDEVWSVDVVKTFNGRNIMWGYSESPLIIGDTVICTPGGDDVSMVALNKKTGEVVWKAKGVGGGPGYASPILIDYEGLQQIVMPMAESIIGVRASDGELLWNYPHKVYTNQNITTPLFQDGYVIISACGRQGTTSLRLNVAGDQCAVELCWHNETLDDKHGGLILVDDRIYGYAESQQKSEPWVCVDFESGETIFQSNLIESSYKWRNGCLTYADGMFYLYTDDGKMALAKATDTGFELAGTLEIEDPGKRQTWAHPVVFGGKLYIRYGDKLGVYNVAEGDA